MLTNRAIFDDRNIQFQWMNDVKNAELSLNLYLYGGETHQYDKDRDIDEFSIQILGIEG